MINTRMSASSCRTENEVSHETKVQAEKIWNLLLDARAPSSLFTLSRGGSKLELSTAPQETQPLSSRRNAVRPPPAASLSLTFSFLHISLEAKYKYTES